MSMVAQDPDRLRVHEEEAADLLTRIGNAPGTQKARQALALALFLTGKLDEALEVGSVRLLR